MVLAVIVCLAPAIIGCAMFDATRPIFERAMGKVVALILLQTAGLIVLQIVLMGDQWFIAQAVTASFNAMAGGSALGDEIQILVALVVWFVAGAFAMYNLPAIAYSIGAGVAVSGPPLLLLYQPHAITLRREGWRRRATRRGRRRLVTGPQRHPGAPGDRGGGGDAAAATAPAPTLHRQFDREITPCGSFCRSSCSPASPVARRNTPGCRSRPARGCRRTRPPRR